MPMRVRIGVGLLAMSFSAAVPMHREGDGSLQQQQTAPSLPPCVDRALPPNSTWSTCLLQQEHGLCSHEQNHYPEGYCAKTCGNCPAQTAAAEKVVAEKTGERLAQPHIVLWLVDDQGWSNVGYNNRHVYTPSMDALSSQGIRLQRQYAAS